MVTVYTSEWIDDIKGDAANKIQIWRRVTGNAPATNFEALADANATFSADDVNGSPTKEFIDTSVTVNVRYEYKVVVTRNSKVVTNKGSTSGSVVVDNPVNWNGALNTFTVINDGTFTTTNDSSKENRTIAFYRGYFGIGSAANLGNATFKVRFRQWIVPTSGPNTGLGGYVYTPANNANGDPVYSLESGGLKVEKRNGTDYLVATIIAPSAVSDGDIEVQFGYLDADGDFYSLQTSGNPVHDYDYTWTSVSIRTP